ncbi:hypothetical protein SUGI_1092130 [Cryptomeria japonica]|nr:hypothetical protein SUGI_1092130 [Cryptomeria japonica]
MPISQNKWVAIPSHGTRIWPSSHVLYKFLDLRSINSSYLINTSFSTLLLSWHAYPCHYIRGLPFFKLHWAGCETELIFRNLMAVNICQQKELTIISDFLFLMDSLIQSVKDLTLLRKKGLIQSSIGTDMEVADMFNGLCNWVNFTLVDGDEFSEVKSAINKWYKRQIIVRIKELKELVETNPKFVKAFTMFWGIVLVLAAVAPSVVQIAKHFFPNMLV